MEAMTLGAEAVIELARMREKFECLERQATESANNANLGLRLLSAAARAGIRGDLNRVVKTALEQNPSLAGDLADYDAGSLLAFIQSAYLDKPRDKPEGKAKGRKKRGHK